MCPVAASVYICHPNEPHLLESGGLKKKAFQGSRGAWCECGRFIAGIKSLFGPEGFCSEDRTDKKSVRPEHLMSFVAVSGQRRLLPLEVP